MDNEQVDKKRIVPRDMKNTTNSAAIKLSIKKCENKLH